MGKTSGPQWSRVVAASCAQHAESLIRSLGDYDHVRVRANGQHLVVERRDDSEDIAVARLTLLGDGVFALGFRRHTGRWEPMPISGPLETVVADLIATLGVYLERDTSSLGTYGTSH